MPRPNDTSSRPTSVLVRAGEILRVLKPATLGTLLTVYEDNSLTQEEIAESVRSGRSTITKYLRSLDDLGLIESHASQYPVTSTGETVISHIASMVDQVWNGLSTVDWTDENDKAELATYLEPLCGSRKISIESYFILYSIYTRSGTTGLLGRPQSVRLEDIVLDVETRQYERDEQTSTEQIRGKLERFAAEDAIIFEDQQATLTEKGQQQGRVLDDLARFLEEYQPETSTSDERDGHHHTATSSTEDTTAGTPVDTSSTPSDSGSLAQQIQPHGFLGREPVSIEEDEVPPQETPTAIPVFCIRSASDDTEDASRSSLTPVVPFTSMTANELMDHISTVVREHDGEVQLEPFWMPRIGEQFYPVEPADVSISDSSGGPS